MKKVFLILFLLILAGCDSSTPVSPNITIQPDNLDRDTLMEETDPELVDSLWEFTSLTQELLESEDNEVYSPLSLYLALSMLLPATSETTHDELLEGLSISSTENFEENIQPLLKKNNILDDEEDYANLLTNSIWLQNDRDDYDEEILEVLENRYQAMHQFTDFKNEEKTKELIEAFIDEQTNGFIQELDLNIDSSITLLLLNTLYFKDQWQEQFKQETEFEFTTKDDKTIEVKGVMKKFENPKYYVEDDLEMVMIPFRNGNQMLFIKPEDIARFFEQDKISDIHSLLENLEYSENTSVNLTMPEVDISSNFKELNKFLASLSFTELMSDAPYLSYIEGEETGMIINDIVQQARITVDREGAEAAAYTSIGVEETSIPIIEEEIEMILDQPYVMVVLSPEYIPMFVSTVNNPANE
ncbi:MAG TPA: serpin family protein [Atopostipes sp.]|nr:serpin family protein [Atopostipes sp.]